MVILGISCFYHDSAACLIRDGEILTAVQEERFTRIKNDSAFPMHAIRYCIESQRIQLSEIDHIVFYEKPLLKFERLIETYISHAPRGLRSFLKSMPLWLKEKLFQKKRIIDYLKQIDPEADLENKILFSQHHLSHASSAFYPSPFSEAAIVVLDGVGEWSTTSIWKGDGRTIELLKEIHFPHSLGLLYSSFTAYLGFTVNSDEYKVMGLAPYGEPKYADLIKENLITLRDDGSYLLNLDFFDYPVGLKMVNKKFEVLFGQPTRLTDSGLTKFHTDIAASIQKVAEECVLKIVGHAVESTQSDNLCLAGGVALNCVINGKIAERFPSLNIWIQPAAGDAGGSLGAALQAWYTFSDSKILKDVTANQMKNSLLGPSFSNQEIKEYLTTRKINSHFLADFDELCQTVAGELKSGKIVGWFQGKMEFGPRALGNRSILADPRNATMQRELNLKIKFRESFRPFAPAVLEEHTSEYFNYAQPSPYMLIVSEVSDRIKVRDENSSHTEKSLEELLAIPRSTIPAVTHIDYSARLQTVNKNDHPKFYTLIEKFYQLTDCPILLNTSFNVKDEPIVCSYEDAFSCFEKTKMDMLVMENYVIYKTDYKEGVTP